MLCMRGMTWLGMGCSDGKARGERRDLTGGKRARQESEPAQYRSGQPIESGRRPRKGRTAQTGPREGRAGRWMREGQIEATQHRECRHG